MAGWLQFGFERCRRTPKKPSGMAIVGEPEQQNCCGLFRFLACREERFSKISVLCACTPCGWFESRAILRYFLYRKDGGVRNGGFPVSTTPSGGAQEPGKLEHSSTALARRTDHNKVQPVGLLGGFLHFRPGLQVKQLSAFLKPWANSRNSPLACSSRSRSVSSWRH